MAAPALTRFRLACHRFEHSIRKFVEIFRNPGLHPALIGAEHPTRQTQPSSFEETLKEGFLWAAPKNRRSLERRTTRKFQYHNHFQYATPRKDIVACLECGHWHERNTLCGNCYMKVKEETQAMIASVDKDSQYRPIETEMVYLYEDEIELRNKFASHRNVVEVKKKKPQWWSRNLLTSAIGRK